MCLNMLDDFCKCAVLQRENQKEIHTLWHSHREVQTSTDHSEGIDQETREKIRE